MMITMEFLRQIRSGADGIRLGPHSIGHRRLDIAHYSVAEFRCNGLHCHPDTAPTTERRHVLHTSWHDLLVFAETLCSIASIGP